MRVLFAGLFVFIGLIASFLFFTWLLPPNTPPAIISALICVLMVILVVGALVLFNLGNKRFPPFEGLEKLKEKGLVDSMSYEATRAFEVEEFEDEGAIFFVELKDGKVLFLCGQYLYDYQPSDGKYEDKRSRRFPCRQFTLLRHKIDAYVLDVVCEGEPFEPEFQAPSFSPENYDSDDFPGDGDIITKQTYDELKAKYSKSRNR